MKPIFRNTCFAVLALLVAGFFAACSDDDTQDGDLQLYYPTVVDIGPSMHFVSGSPTYKGPAPSEFSIAGVTLDDAAIACDSFSINPDTGIVTIADTDDLATGVYKLSISCRAGGGFYTFRDVFVVSMAAATPESVEVSTSLLEIPYDELETADIEVRVTPVGKSVSIQNYTLVQAEGKEYFAISRDGVITLSSSFKGEVLPGTYPLSVKIDTYAGSTTYDDILTVRITSLPLEVRYPSAAGRMEYDMAFTSSTPSCKASPEGLAWAIKGTTPATDLIVIDPVTGVLSVEAGNGFAVGDSFTVDLAVTNDYGTADFDGAFTLTVIAYIAPIDPDTFGYDDAEAIQGAAFSAAPQAGLVGDEVIFSLGELDEQLEGQIVIDEVTGVVSAAKGQTIPLGTYSIPVKAANLKSEAETTLTLSIIENPYFFTKIHYGNNLGLEPSEDYANQYYAASANELKAEKHMPTTDAKEGVELVWEVKAVHQLGNTTIDSATGELTLAGFKANNGGMVLVTATAGKGKEGETSVTVPVFASFIQELGDAKVLYKPFVMQVNPRKGGISAAPEITCPDPALFLMDYRRTFNYYNIAGPEQHGSGTMSKDTPGILLYELWGNYYTSLNKANIEYGSKDPISYYSNTSTLGSALLYVEPMTKAVVVNANKWIDHDNVAANGAFIAQMTYVTDGTVSNVNGSNNQVFPLWVWFDEKF